ncbi:MAG: aspartate/glutamate racemase family protein [Bacteroidetes bacterium]|nr:aspartate/glutamate racemase family protein [Bacteroidota bacterium]
MKHLLLMTAVVGTMMIASPKESRAQGSPLARIGQLAERDTLKVLVTDSGLGGLAVCADIELRARQSGIYRRLQIIFANALPESNRGYNRMKSTAEKVRVFDDALGGMERWYAPDVILVACNTLSVLIPQTSFVTTSAIPVLGIVETGVDMLFEKLSADPRSTAVIFGTETTIGAGTHRRLLLERGVDSVRIVTQACPNLAGKIESDARGEKVVSAIAEFAGEAMGKIERTSDPVLVGLCCTHYGYAAREFEKAMRKRGAAGVEIVDPNSRMSNALFPPGRPRRAEGTDVSVEVVSRAEISPEEIASIGALVDSVSHPTAQALRTYELKRDLFPYVPPQE